MKPPKLKTCKHCRTKFTPDKPLQMVCGFDCAIEYGVKQKQRLAEKKAKADRKVTRERREKLKYRSDYIKEVQIVFNRYCRLRDYGLGCISCDASNENTSLAGGDFDAGHFLSRGAKPHLRFDERNCHAQCKRCNRYLSGNIANYRERLIVRIGLQAVQALEADNEPRHYTIDQLKELKKHYANLCKELVKLRESA